MSDTLTKSHVVEAVAKDNGYTRNKSYEIAEIMLELIKTASESRRGRDDFRIWKVLLEGKG
jgi:nucleoid DNA-binding protein